MSLPSRFAPPAHLRDFGDQPDGHAHWHRFISETFDDAVANLSLHPLQDRAGTPVPAQFFSPQRFTPAQPLVHLPIRWNAFPRSLLLRHGRAKAMVLADMLWPVGLDEDFDPLASVTTPAPIAPKGWMRPQDEYCEWRVEREHHTGRICRVIFTAEAPEIWTALFGGPMPHLRAPGRADRRPLVVPGNPEHAARLYGRLLGRRIDAGALTDGTTAYNPHNPWNTTHGIVHLTHPNNSLCAAVALVADSTRGLRHPGGPDITLPEALCSGMRFGDPNNHSDPAIVGTVQALARAGAWITLADPVGPAMEDVDTNGWAFPDTDDARQLLHIERGGPGQMLRLVVQAPAGSRHLLDRLTINGEPLQHGGQIAECITVQLSAACTAAGATPPAAPLAPARQGRLPDANRRLIRTFAAGEDITVAGLLPAFAAPPLAPERPGSHPGRQP